MLKKFLCLLISVLIIISLFFGCSKKGIGSIIITPLNQQAKEFDIPLDEPVLKTYAKPYSIKQDLSNISNNFDITELDAFDKYMLARNSFIIKKPSKIFEQPFDIYEENESEGIPNFITCDSILHAYNLINNYVLKSIEKERLADELKIFTENAFNNSISIYNGISEKKAKKAALKNIAYFGIAMRLMEIDLPGGIPLEANRMIDNDIKRIRLRWASGTSEIFSYYVDYKDYVVRGFYSKDTNLKNYYLTLLWYSNTPIMFEIYDEKEEILKRSDEQIVMSVLMASEILGDNYLRNIWEDLYKVNSAYYGKAGALTLYDLSDIIKVIYGEKMNLNKVWDDEKIKKVYELAKQRYDINSKETIGGKINLARNNSKQQVKFKLMGDMYYIDTDIYNNLTNDFDQERPLPKGLDLPACFGSNNAYEILKFQMNEDEKWDGYTANLQRLKSVLSKLNIENPNNYSLNDLLFWILKPYTSQYNETYPTFMTSEYWENKKLITYLASISDLKHISSLQAKQSGEADSEEKKISKVPMPGYVEPEVNIYGRLEYAGKYLKTFLSDNKFKDQTIYNALDDFISIVSFLKNISIKELSNTPLTDEEAKKLKNFGDELKSLLLQAVESKNSNKQWKQISQSDRNIASIVDVYQKGSYVLQTAIGAPDYIYVVVSYEDKLYITRGSVYSYYEIVRPSSKKIDDKEWLNMIKEGKEIEQPIWIKKIRN